MESSGYLRIATLPVHIFPPGFRDFEEYTRRVRASYRRSIRITQRKLHNAGVRLERVEDPVQLIALYGEAEHQLYRAVEAKAAYHFEIVTQRFFHALARACPGELTCALAYAPSGQIIGFQWSLLTGGRFHTIYVGLDYAWNARCELYFNLFYADLDYALRRGATYIDLGQTAESFKTRLGAQQEPRYLCFQALNPLLAYALRRALPLLTLPENAVPAHHVFRTEPGTNEPP
jgi:predicted N-acyltransferase